MNDASPAELDASETLAMLSAGIPAEFVKNVTWVRAKGEVLTQMNAASRVLHVAPGRRMPTIPDRRAEEVNQTRHGRLPAERSPSLTFDAFSITWHGRFRVSSSRLSPLLA